MKIKNKRFPVILAIFVILLVSSCDEIVDEIFGSSAPTATQSAVLDLDINTLVGEMQSNAARANQLYHNITIRTTGTITQIDNDSVWIGRGSGMVYMLELLVFFNPSEMSKLPVLNLDQIITVRGVFDGSGPFQCIRNAVIETPGQVQQSQQQQLAPAQQQQPAQQGSLDRSEYQGTMVRGNTTLNINFFLGGFANQRLINTYYVYTTHNIPIALEGEFDANGILYIWEGGTNVTGTFIFQNFDSNAPVVTGIWFSPSEPNNPYGVTLIKR